VSHAWNYPTVVLRVDTAELLRRHSSRVQLAPYNTGDLRFPDRPSRGSDVFKDIDDYPYAAWRAVRAPGRDAVGELTVKLLDAAELITSAERWTGGELAEVLYEA
jgi:hypothetical protein